MTPSARTEHLILKNYFHIGVASIHRAAWSCPSYAMWTKGVLDIVKDLADLMHAPGRQIKADEMPVDVSVFQALGESAGQRLRRW